jgi:hypothetical protein
MKRRGITGAAKVCIAMTLAALGACTVESTSTSGASSGGDDPSVFHDVQGRTCHPLGGIGKQASCDVAPMPSRRCQANEEACFVVLPDPEFGVEAGKPVGKEVLRLCAGCCRMDPGSGQAQSLYLNEDCSSLVGTTPDDGGGQANACLEARCRPVR